MEGKKWKINERSSWQSFSRPPCFVVIFSFFFLLAPRQYGVWQGGWRLDINSSIWCSILNRHRESRMEEKHTQLGDIVMHDVFLLLLLPSPSPAVVPREKTHVKWMYEIEPSYWKNKVDLSAWLSWNYYERGDNKRCGLKIDTVFPSEQKRQNPLPLFYPLPLAILLTYAIWTNSTIYLVPWTRQSDLYK